MENIKHTPKNNELQMYEKMMTEKMMKEKMMNILKCRHK